MAGLDPAIPIPVAQYCVPQRDRRAKPGNDSSGFADHRDLRRPYSASFSANSTMVLR